MHWLDASELAAVMMGMPDDTEPDEVDQALFDRFNIELDTFQKIAEALVPLTIPARVAISGEAFQGFVKNGAFIVKERVGASCQP